MKKTSLMLAVLAALSATSTAVMAEDSPHTISANVGFVTDYQYRGWSQTDEKMALQGGFDYAHSSGAYAGVWGSNVSWLDEGSLEVDIYGGYAGEVGDFGYDVGLLQYYYPAGRVGGMSADTLEAYAGVSYGPVSFKFSHAFSELFGIEDSDGSQYYDLSLEQEVGAGFTLGAHFGRQKIEGGGSYNDWKLGVSTELAGFGLELAYVDTDVDGADLADKRVILSVSRSF